MDNDCDGETDEDDAVDATSWNTDGDGDGFGDWKSDDLELACDQPSGYVDDASDCDDTDATVNPDAEELDDGIDNDCDGEIDEGFTTDTAPPDDTDQPVDTDTPDDTDQPVDTGEPKDEPTPTGCTSRAGGASSALLLPFVFLGVRRRW